MVINLATGVHYQLALVIMTKADLSRYLNQQAHGHELVTVSPYSLSGSYQIVGISSLVAMVHIVKNPYQDHWFINNQINLQSFNQFYQFYNYYYSVLILVHAFRLQQIDKGIGLLWMYFRLQQWQKFKLYIGQ